MPDALKQLKQIHYVRYSSYHHLFNLFSVAVWTGNPPLGQQTGVLQLLHPIPAELPTQGMVNPGRPAEPHQPRPSQRGA